MPEELGLSGVSGWVAVVRADQPTIYLGGLANHRFGATLAVGDYNGDGVPDLAVGVPGHDVWVYDDKHPELTNPGEVHVWLGPIQESRDPDHILSTGNSVADGFGWSILAWDPDGDGRDALVVGMASPVDVGGIRIFDDL